MSSSVTCWSGIGEVTGSNFELSGDFGRILVDCGLIQGSRFCEKENLEPFAYDPKDIDVLVVTHAHLDHIGRIPKLVRDGFRGPIYSTVETHKLVEVMFEDALQILTQEAQRDGHAPPYERKDVVEALSLWRGLSYHEKVDLPKSLSFQLLDAGHILGSAMVEFSRSGVKMVFTGDLGNSPAPLLRSTEELSGVQYLLMESVYGDRNHEPQEERDRRFADAVLSTVKRGGTVVIPAFSLERTQNILFTLHNLSKEGLLPEVPVFVDSPLAIKVTEIYREGGQGFSPETMRQMQEGDIFSLPRLTLARTQQDSQAIARVHGPKIILAGSGMSAGGRVTRHEKEYLPDPKSTILLVGYQSLGTLGRSLDSGAREVVIGGERVPVRATLLNIRGFSSHKDSEGLVSFVGKTAPSLKQVFVAMGEPKASLFLVQRLRDYLDVPAIYPERGKSYVVEI
ncbi:MBL fold metallo-hydrolase [Candidatus Parcubacteria bacterium]|nr:MBL fold metallo-hydrolase [Candidatus Parcubacteria bacterium]